MCNFFQKGVQFLKIQQIVWLGMHLVIHLWTPLNRNRNQKTKKGLKELHRSLFFLFLSSKIHERFILQAPACILKSHRTRWVILSVVQAEFEGGCSRKKASAWKQRVQAEKRGCGSLQPAGCVSCENRSSLYPIPLSAVQRPSCHRLFAPLCVLSRASPT